MMGESFDEKKKAGEEMEPERLQDRALGWRWWSRASVDFVRLIHA